MNTVSLYDRNIAILKNYNGQEYKLVLCKALRKKGFEIDNNSKYRCKINSRKLDENITRAKARVKEYALCNDFEYFITLTIDSKKYDRTNLKSYYKDFSQWLRDYKKKHNCNIKYIFIPELHNDKQSWHMHGFISGIPKEDLHLFNEYDNVPLKLIEKGYYNWVNYNKKFGFCSLGVINDKAKASSYITKYISKDVDKSVTELNAKMYYCSKGLKKATEMKRGLLTSDMSNPDFENDYVKVKVYDGGTSIEQLKKLISD